MRSLELIGSNTAAIRNTHNKELKCLIPLHSVAKCTEGSS